MIDAIKEGMSRFAAGLREEFGDAKVSATELVGSNAYIKVWPKHASASDTVRRGLLTTHLSVYIDTNLDGLVIRRSRTGRTRPYMYWVEPQQPTN